MHERGAGRRVAILLGSFDGEAYLRAQLASIAAQTHGDWSLLVSDDGSRDRTRDIVAAFAAEIGGGRVRLCEGPRRGFVANFLGMACRSDLDADYFAFCDQDDLWHPHKLAHAIETLERAPAAGHPARLYGGRTLLVDDRGGEIGMSPLFCGAPSFANALVQSYAGANTMVFNAAARALLQRLGPVEGVASHDWWAYLVVSGAGGRVIYDPQPMLRYRQHDDNLQGHNRGLGARVRRLLELLAGRMRGWNAAHVAALSAHADLLTADNRAVLEAFREALAGQGFAALRALARSGAVRQRRIDNLALKACALVGRL